MRLRHSQRRGLTLAEVIISTFLVGILLTAALSSVGGALRSTTSASTIADASSLASMLLEEIVILPYEDPNQTPSFGFESGESFSSGTRVQADDLDDFNGFSQSPPKLRNGVLIPGFTGWTWSVTVSPRSTPVAMMVVTVVVRAPDSRITTRVACRTRNAGALQPQGISQTLVTWTGVSMQTGTSSPVSGGVSLVNHAADQ